MSCNEGKAATEMDCAVNHMLDSLPVLNSAFSILDRNGAGKNALDRTAIEIAVKIVENFD